MKIFDKFGVQIPEILLPKSINLKTWSVIACDQYTQDFNYWKSVKETVGTDFSTLNLIFPEVYLNEENPEERIKTIKKTMKDYIEKDIFNPSQQCVYIERKTAYGRTRKGLVLAIDLEKYEWQPNSKALIRATEATVPERIPPRMKIRTNAPLELPHIMLLANDEDDLLIGKCAENAKKTSPIYDGDLMEQSGHITGWAVKGSEAESIIETALETLYKKGTDSQGNTFLFAVGDGNHSLATAKAVWDEYKKNLSEEEQTTSPIRYALVEIVNIYDEGLTFEPIHRVMFNFDTEDLINYVCEKLNGNTQIFNNEDLLKKAIEEKSEIGARYGFIYIKNGITQFKMIQTNIKDLAIAALQPILDSYMNEKSAQKTQIDYIHGTDEVTALGKMENNTGILLPPIAKDSFFATINGRGPLPRKSFSMGEASEKRFYVEARKLFS